MDWQSRIENYVRETGFPPAFWTDAKGEVYGFWRMGNNYRVKSGYHGGYPNTYLRRVKALFPDKKQALHVFSGKVDLEAFPGDTVDINPDLSPTFVDDAQTLASVPLSSYDIFLVDPPYTGEDADHYGTTMVKRISVMRAIARGASPGSHVVWLDQALVNYRKDEWAVEASIAVERSTMHRYRGVKVFRRLGGSGVECPSVTEDVSPEEAKGMIDKLQNEQLPAGEVRSFIGRLQRAGYLASL